MGRKPKDQPESETAHLHYGKDEMNLIEHSLSGADKNVDRSKTSVTFTKDDKDPETGALIERRWEVSWSAKWGRPTAKDDDVFIGLMKLSADQKFASPRIEFTRYELLKIIGWPDDGPHYKAIDDAFNRLIGVHVIFTRSWYDNAAGSWVDKKFHIIQDVHLYRRENSAKVRDGKLPRPKSSFTWSKTMQESFDAGYLRTLDLELYRSIENPIARKLFRYLGKHFYYRTKHSIEIKELCHNKLGYSQNETRNSRLRQKVEPAIKELEEKEIFGLTHEFKSSYGKCKVVFQSSKEARPTANPPVIPLAQQLIELGIAREDALLAVATHKADRILEDIEDVEFREKNGKIKQSKAGLLAKMLESAEPWPRPEGFKAKTQYRDLPAEEFAAIYRANNVKAPLFPDGYFRMQVGKERYQTKATQKQMDQALNRQWNGRGDC